MNSTDAVERSCLAQVQSGPQCKFFVILLGKRATDEVGPGSHYKQLLRLSLTSDSRFPKKADFFLQ